MTVMEANRRLDLLGIPRIALGKEREEVRDILARLMASGSLMLSDMQLLRDVAESLPQFDVWVYLLLAAMRLSLKAGNTYLRQARGPEFLGMAGMLEEIPEGWRSNEEFRADVRGKWKDCVTPAASRLVENLGQLLVVRTINGTNGPDTGWFFVKVFDAVEAVSRKLKELDGMACQGKDLDPKAFAAAIRFNGKNGKAFDLNAQQQEAVRKVAQRNFVVVTGGPGTGKTTVVCSILRALLERGDLVGEDIALVAPTGRAAQRMGEALHQQCASAVDLPDAIADQINALAGSTIHSLLGGFPPNWKYTADNRLPHKLVVVDESSMVDVNLMQALLEALPGGCRLVLLGDKDQLPSVDVGAVLGDIVANFGDDTVVRLTESKRFTEEFAGCASSINAGKVDAFKTVVKALPMTNETWTTTLAKEGRGFENCVFRYELAESVKDSRVQALLLEWARHYGLIPLKQGVDAFQGEGRLISLAKAVLEDDEVFTSRKRTSAVAALFDHLDRSRILTVVRNGLYGARGVNELIVRSRFHGRLPANPLEKVGVPILVTRNTRERNLWNGDIGVTVRGPSGMVALFPRGDAVEVCPVGLLPEHDLAYAITIHKSQGSEFENVLVVLPPNEDNPLLSRPLLYTGVTRAKVRAVVLGTGKVMVSALRRDVARDSGVA